VTYALSLTVEKLLAGISPSVVAAAIVSTVAAVMKAGDTITLEISQIVLMVDISNSLFE
jgi:hypothetical protein